MTKIRFGYCPPNPVKPPKRVKWYCDVENALKEYDGISRIYVSINNKKYEEITYEELERLYK